MTAFAGIHLGKTGFRVKPGMTIKVKRLMGHYTRHRLRCQGLSLFLGVFPKKFGYRGLAHLALRNGQNDGLKLLVLCSEGQERNLDVIV